MTKVIFVRHGRTNYNEEGKYDGIGNAQLTEVGKNQAKEIAEIFKNEKIHAIYASPLQRCIDTITPLALSKNLEIISDNAFIEIQSPDIQDKVFSCKEYKWENWYGGGEKIIEVDERVKSGLEKIIKNHDWETVVICAHWDTTFMGRNFFHNYDYDTEKYSCDLFLENNPEKYDIHAMYGIEETK